MPAATIVEVAREIAAAAPAFASHIWRAAAAGNLHGWQVTRSLWLLNVLTGSVGTEGGVSPNAWNKFIPAPWRKPAAAPPVERAELAARVPARAQRDELPLPALPARRPGDASRVLFTRVLNPIWTYPDGYSWLRALRDETRVGLHGALTPTWSETAWWADYVLPMGHGPERHDTHSYETHAGRWLGFRQPVRRVAMERLGQKVEFTYEANPGEVWEEGEFWIEVSWRADPDGSLGIRHYYESPYRPGEKITLEEYYRWMFENSVPGLPEKAEAEGLDPLGYMRRYGAVEISRGDYAQHEAPVAELDGHRRSAATRTTVTQARARRLAHCRSPAAPTRSRRSSTASRGEGFNTPVAQARAVLRDARRVGLAASRRRPRYARSHVHHSLIDHAAGEYVLLPTYRLPTMIHSRSGNAKYLNELSHTHPLLVCPEDAERIGLTTERPRARGDRDRLVRDQGARHRGDPARGRRRLAPHGPLAAQGGPGQRALVERAGGHDRATGSRSRFRRLHGVQPWESTDPSSRQRVVERRRRAPEHHLPGAPGPDQRHALLAPEGARAAGRARRPLRRHPRRLRAGARRVPQVARR